MQLSRRTLVVTGAGLGVTGWAAGLPGVAARAAEQSPGAHDGGKAPAEDAEEDVSPAEDLMREHGALERILLIYENVLRRLQAKQDLPQTAQPLADAADIVRSFVEDYHEKLEEDFLFPRFQKAGKLLELVDVLRQQHQAGRRLTEAVLHLANAKSLASDDDRQALGGALRGFVRMYLPHAAREDTVLFPAFRRLVSEHEYDSLGEEFEKREHQLFGADGFEKMIDRIAGIEKALGIYDLAQFTPRQ
jgi:hemerythrin-like domain-containing protein